MPPAIWLIREAQAPAALMRVLARISLLGIVTIIPLSVGVIADTGELKNKSMPERSKLSEQYLRTAGISSVPSSSILRCSSDFKPMMPEPLPMVAEIPNLRASLR